MNRYTEKTLKWGLILSWALLLLFDLLFRGFPWLAHNVGGLRFIANFVLSALGLLCLLYLLSFVRKKWVFILLYTLLIGLPVLLNGSYFLVYNKFISPSGFDVFSESPGMVLTTGAANFNFFFLLAATFTLVVAGFFLSRFSPRRKWPIIPNLIFLASFFVFLLLHWYSVNFFQQSIWAFYESFADELMLNQQKATHPQRVKLSPVNQNTQKPDLVFVVGESQVLSHMSLYGYKRKTTPHLDSLYAAHKIIPFTKAVSIGNKTRLSVPYMLAGLQGPDPNGVFYQYPSIFDYAKAAGYKTLFISAQDLHWGRLDQLFDDGSIDLLLDGNHFSSHVDVHKGVDDLVLLPKILDYLQQYGSPFLLVVQMDGSHYPYNIHSPDSLKRFLPEESPNCTNAFDNTLLVTDIYLYRFYRFLNQYFPGSYLFFTPDHGQNFGGLGGHFNDNFTPDVFHNALIAFPPDGDSLAFNSLMKNKDMLVSQADVFATMLDLMHQKPQYRIDGMSLPSHLSNSRLICCSEYMPTFHNDPNAVVVDSNLNTLYLDFSKKSVTDNRDGRFYRFSQLPEPILNILKRRLNRTKPLAINPSSKP
jgi:glucan phosphoethanolaminetransferase (alkaline phosphatase superfamily)